MDDGIDVDALMRYVHVLENAICIADESRADDPAYGLRVIAVMANRIRMAAEAAAAEAARRRMLH
jgi:hypothetical protein